MMIWWSSSPSAGASSIEFSWSDCFCAVFLIKSVSLQVTKSRKRKSTMVMIMIRQRDSPIRFFLCGFTWPTTCFFCNGVAFENDVMLILSFSHLPIAYIAQLQNLAAFIISNSLVEIAKDHKEFLYGTLLQLRENVYSLYLSLYRLCPQFSHPIHHTSWIKMTPVCGLPMPISLKHVQVQCKIKHINAPTWWVRKYGRFGWLRLVYFCWCCLLA